MLRCWPRITTIKLTVPAVTLRWTNAYAPIAQGLYVTVQTTHRSVNGTSTPSDRSLLANDLAATPERIEYSVNADG